MAKLTLDTQEKTLFAAYLNMAVNNVCIILNDIALKLELKSGNGAYYKANSDKCSSFVPIQESFLNKLSVDKQEALKSRLLNQFPFLKAILSRFKFHSKDHQSYLQGGRTIDYKTAHIFANDDIHTIAQKLRQILDVLTIYRNMSTHSMYNIKSDFDDVIKKTAFDLDRVFLVSCIIIKERFNLANDLAFVNNDRANSKLKPIRPNFTSPHCVFTDDFYMSKGALVLLTSIFIEKKYSTIMFARLDSFYKLSNGKFIFQEPRRRLLRELYTCNTIRLPKRDLSTSYATTILGLDMLNEISKCPEELYETLSVEDKNTFVTETADIIEGLEDELLNRLDTQQKTVYYDNNNDCFKDKQALYNNVPDNIKKDYFITQNGKMLRYDDRFPELAMRWFDQTNKFGKLRFQVIYGKYHEIFAKAVDGIKHCADGENRERWIERNLIAFGRIQDIDKIRNSTNWKGFSKLKKATEDGTLSISGHDPWITDFTPQYLIERNNIGLKLTDGKPDELNYESPNSEPDFWMSVFDLPGMVFYQYLLDMHKGLSRWKSIENILVSIKHGYIKLFTDLHEGKLKPSDNVPYGRPLADSFAAEYANYKINWKNIPSKIKDYIYPIDKRDTTDAEGHLFENKPRTTFEEYVKKIIGIEIEKTESLLKRYENLIKAPKRPDKNAKRLRPGNLGSFLAEDIVYLLEYRNETHTDKQPDTPTGLNFDALQKVLARFNNKFKFKIVKDTIQNLHIIGNAFTNEDKEPCQHPFLDAMMSNQYSNVIELYKDYLDRRKEYFEQLSKEIEDRFKRKQPLKQLMFHQYKKKWGEKNDAYYKSLGNSYLENDKHKQQPFLLPNGIFANEIRDIIVDLLKDKGIDANDKAMKLLCDKSKPANVTIMIEIYHKYILNDDTQHFYTFNRSYELFKELNKGARKAGIAELSYGYNNAKGKFDRPKFSELKAYIDNYYECKIKEEDHNAEREEKNKSYFKKLFTEYQQNERALNRISVQDMLLFYISQNLTQIKPNSFKLSDVKPNASTGILSQSIPVEFTLENGFTIRWSSIKIKETTRIFKLLNDARLKGILSLYEKEQAKKGPFDSVTIERELEKFDLNRCKIFESIFEVENKVYDVAEIQTIFATDDYVDFDTIINVLKTKNPSIDSDLENLREIRNCFAHNDYIKVDKYSLIDGVEGETIADRMLSVFNTIKDKVVNAI